MRIMFTSFLERLDAIFFDEIGMINDVHLVMMDHILRRVKGVKKPYGGCLFGCVTKKDMQAPPQK